MRSAVMFAGVLFTVALMQPVAATATVEQAADWKPSISLSAPKPSFKPYVVDWGARPSVDLKAASKPTVVCGMTLVPADPKVDPKMRVAPPANGTTFTMTVVPPTVCKP
jgi:hypothetical protein